MGGIEKTQLEILEDLITDPDLEHLESISDQFNIFDALGMIHVEVRHSKFLSWLLDPKGSHGLGDYLLGMFMKSVSAKTEGGPTIFDVDTWDLSNAEIRVEWNHIDILIVCESQKCVCVIENKIHSSEHSQQLSRYRNIVENTGEFSKFDKLYLYLTVSGEIPSDDNYVPMTYGNILDLLSHLLTRKKDELGPDVLTLISHYDSMLRRYIMEDSDIQEICRAIYKKHRKALDLIYEYKPDRLREIYDFLVEIIEDDKDLELDDHSKTYIRFMPREMDIVPKTGTWTRSKRMLLFQFNNYDNGLALHLIIGPGPEETREELYAMARNEDALFKQSRRKLTDQYFTIYKYNFITSKELETLAGDELRTKLNRELKHFKKSDMPIIVEIVKRQYH